MSAAQESLPPPSRGPRGASSSNRRGRGGNSGGSGGGRRANFGGSLTSSSDQPSNSNSSSRGGRSNNHSRATRSHAHKDKSVPTESQDDSATEEATGSSISNGEQSQDSANQNAAAAAAAADDDDDDDKLPPDGELCFICADPIKLTSVAPCDHRTCHICALRLRVLYKKDECTFCKSTIDRLIFTSSSTKNFADFKPSDIPYTDKKLPISFETKEALEETALLLRFNCPDPNCEVACTGWRDYKGHVRREHNRLVCQLCISNKKIFAHEHTMHTEQSLVAHEKAEHRLCEYDRRLFYSDDELFAHMRDQHEQCFICKTSGNEEERWKYYRDYNMLEKHFRKQHWLCENPECLQNKFVVFADEVAYKAHQVKEHANELSARERREAQRIKVNFSYDDGGEGSRSGAARNGGGNKGKSRANGAAAAAAGGDASGSTSGDRDVLGVSALASRAHVPGAGPANHQSRRAMFGSGLTNPSAPQGVSADRPRTVNDTRSVEERHQAYMDKVSSTFGGSEARITSFRHSVRAFKQGESSARDLISTFHSLVGEMDECAPLVNGLVDLLDDQDKSKALGDAWSQYRIERTQFPSLTPAGASGVGITPGTGYAGAGSRAGGTLRSIKKSSAASSSQVWDNVERAASASSGHGAGKPVALREHFPSLGTASTSSGTPSIPGSLAHAVAHGAASRSAAPAAKWSAASAAVSGRSAGASAAAAKPFVSRVHSNSNAGGRVNTHSSAAFPSLPTNAAKSAINAHKKALFANKTAGGSHSPGGGLSGSGTPAGSGASTPWIAAQPGRIDDFPEMAGSGTAAAGLGSLDGLSEALVASQQGEGGSGGRKKKGKGVQVMAFGGVHRG